jgi:L-ascorbate metabolism protein UlaG (beta-lactamase superfamily)
MDKPLMEREMLKLRNVMCGLVLVAAMTAPALAAEVTGDEIQTSDGPLVIHPVNHASMVLSWNGEIIYVDPVGGADVYKGLPAPDVIFLTDVHGDHFDDKTLAALDTSDTEIVAPKAVADGMSEDVRKHVEVMANGDTSTVAEIGVEAMPMYNNTKDLLQYHPKGRGNGYVLTLGGKRIYIAGDTEDTPEMRALKDIDVAFIPMNLPYTMTVDQAADAVLAFKPKVVYPYHYKGSDVQAFEGIVEAGDAHIDVRLADWY